MRILSIGNYASGWTTETYVLRALQGLGHEVVTVQDSNATRWPQIPGQAVAERCQMVLWQRTWTPRAQVVLPAIQRLRDAGIPIVSYHLDRWWGLGREGELDSSPFFATDLVVSPDGSPADWASKGINHLWMPPAVDATDATKKVPPTPRCPEIVFVGSVPYPHPEWRAFRGALLGAMAGRFGTRFGVFPKGNVRLWGDQLTSLYRSARVVLGDSCLAGKPAPVRYWSDRAPETMGRGGVLVHPWVEGMEDWYRDGQHLRTFPVGKPDDAVAVVEELLADDEQRERIRAEGQALVLGRDTYAHRMAELLTYVEGHFQLPVYADRGRGFVPPVRPAPAPVPRLIPVTWRSRNGSLSATFHPSDVLGVAEGYQEVWTRNEYELELGMVDRGVVIDIGANVGAFSILAAKLRARRVIAYEPDPDNHAMACEHLDLNRVANLVELHHEAVGGSAGRLALAGEGGGVHRAGPEEPVGVEVPMVSINDVLREAGPVALLKIDTEGAEYDIIEGLDPELLLTVKRLVMETHGPELGHLGHLDDGHQAERWGALVAKLAEYGSMRIFGRPNKVAYIHWALLPANRLRPVEVGP